MEEESKKNREEWRPELSLGMRGGILKSSKVKYLKRRGRDSKRYRESYFQYFDIAGLA